MAFTYSNDVEEGTHTWTALTTSESGTTVELENGAGLMAAITAAAGGGTGFNAGTLTIQVSNDQTTWVTAKDAFGNDVTFTQDGYAELATAAKFIRPTNDASVSDVDVILHLA